MNTSKVIDNCVLCAFIELDRDVMETLDSGFLLPDSKLSTNLYPPLQKKLAQAVKMILRRNQVNNRLTLNSL